MLAMETGVTVCLNAIGTKKVSRTLEPLEVRRVSKRKVWSISAVLVGIPGG
jgi:hypothetical protein